ncbi:filamentous hemagglutinin family protein [Burkholderia cenocepacia]
MSGRTQRQSKSVQSAGQARLLRVRPLCHAIALMLATGGGVHAHAAGIVNLGQATRTAAGGAGGGGGAGIANLGVSPQQALQASQPSILNLGHAAQAIASQIAAQQSAAAAAAATASNVPNGLVAGGLQVAPGVSQTDTTNAQLWYNANLPTQSVDGSGHVTVDIKQTGQNAVLTWQTMNVGSQTTLNFDQSTGTQTNGANNWAVLNRINDPTGRPSQILGNITAQGSVYVINRNGVLFGAGSQVNVHSLVASSLDLLNTNNHLLQTPADVAASNQLFLGMIAGTAGGLANPETNNSTTPPNPDVPNEILGLGNQATVSAANPYSLPGSVTIEPGASITTHTNGTASDGGFVLIAAPNVNNGGSITATAGQVVLAAGVGVSLRPNAVNPQVLQPELSGKLVTAGGADVTPAGTLTNSGLIQAARGNVNLLGSSVAQNGVVGVTTSVNSPGTITISTVDEYSSNSPLGQSFTTNGKPVTFSANGGAGDTHRAGLLTFGPDSVTTVLADKDGQTVTSSPGTTFTAGNITMTAGSVWFQGGSLIEAPGSTVSVAALTPKAALNATPPGDTAVPGRIYLDNGATIDVSGLANVELPISATLVTVPRVGLNELADSPLLRNSILFGMQNVVVDSTLSGTRSDGVQWVGSPILNLSGYVSLIPRTVDQLLTNGGTIMLSGNEVMTAAGSSMNLNGGYVHYLGGRVNTTLLEDASGAIVPIGQASPYDTFVGVAGAFTESHPRWQVTKTWYNPLQTGGLIEPDFIVGGNAGTLDLYATQSLVLDGAISAQAFAGSKQVQGNSQPTGGTFNLGSDPAASSTFSAAGNLAGLTLGASTSTTGESGLVILQDTAPQLDTLSSAFSIDTPFDTTALGGLSATDPDNVLATRVVPVSTLNAGGFATLNVTEDKTAGSGFVVTAGTQLNLQPGGSVKFSGTSNGSTVVAGSITVPAGTISISNGGNITVGPNAVLSTAGQWVNNDVQTAAGTTPGDSQFINGGTVSLSATGSIDLQPGSVIDVSSGGELQANGQLLMSNGVPLGKGGSVSLLTYVAQPGFPAQLPTDDRLTMDGSIRSFGFAGGGTLTLQAPGFQIGGDPASAPAWSVVLPTDFFAQQGFGSYVLNAMFDAGVAQGATVNVTQQNLIPDVPALQRAASGADLSSGGLTTVGTLDAYHRQPTNFVMTGGGYVAWQGNSSSGTTQAVPNYPGVTGGVSVGQGASIVGDAGASIGLGSPAQVTVLGSIVAPGGAITLSADTALTSSYALPGQYTGSGGFTSPGKSVWLGPDAVLDVSGVALTNPLAAPVKSGLTTITPHTGKVLSGGSVTIADDSGYVVAQAGSLINVSGAATNFDQAQPGGGYASQPVWSDAGSITLAASSGLYFDGTFKAQPGASQAEGGTLSIVPEVNAAPGSVEVGGARVALPGATALVVQQSGTLVPAGLAPGQAFTQPLNGVLEFSADRLTGSGISTLVLGSSTAQLAVPIVFTGPVDLNLGKAVIVNAGQLVALGSQQVQTLLGTAAPAPSSGNLHPVNTVLSSLLPDGISTTSTGTAVTIEAPYVALVGPFIGASWSNAVLAPTVKPLADGTLNVNASFIDLENQVQLNNFAQATFTSHGDIRLGSTNGGITQGQGLLAGELFTPGNLTFRAADVYPATGTPFILDATGPTVGGRPTPTTIAFQSNGASDTPLSAGGTLLVDATNIVQGGTVRAPSGTIVFGVGDATAAATKSQFNNLPIVATDSVTFAGGSVTSVSNSGAVIPYGTTVDGVEWQFNPTAGTTLSDLTAPPQKFIGANGSSVALNPGATIDLSGGGNLQAEEWVPGTGGTRDVLSQYNVSYANGATGTAVPVDVGATNVYAIVPGTQSPVAAYDPVFAQTVQPFTSAKGTVGSTTSTLGIGQAGMNGSVGQAVYLSGVPGLAAGYYTLLPGKYATLPGAYRITVSANAGNIAPGSSKVLPDGTVVTAGYFADALTGSRSATPTVFDVQSGSVWQQYSQYTLTGANSFFPALAATKGNVTPPLPVDGGQLVLAATKALTLGATLNTAAGDGGAPAEIDIASQDIQITGNGGAALPGYLQIGADALDSLNAGSLLIGGTRTATTSGVTINPIANSVVLSNNTGNALSGPEILLVTKTGSASTDPDAVNGLQIDAGAAISATGNYPAAKDQPITIAGDGALLRVSNGAMTTVNRTGATGTGLLTVGAGATLTGGQALTLDSSGDLKVDPAAVLSARAITVDGSAITFTNDSSAAAASLSGFVLNPAGVAQLANAQQVILRSAGAINFVGDVNATFGNSVDLSAGNFLNSGGNVTLNAQQIAFTNETGAPQGTAATGSGTLTVNAKEIDFGAGNKTASGFGSVSMTATGGIVGQNSGTFDFGALPVTLNAPVFLADTGSASTLKTSGGLTLNSAAGTALNRTSLGGAWSFIGGTVNDNGATIAAPAGNVGMEATSGDLTIGSGSTIRSAGVAMPFFDVTEYAPAGAITLTSDTGTIYVQPGATLDFSAPAGGGAAGSLSLSAPQQVVNLNGTLKGSAAAGFAGGSFSLDTGGAANLDSLATTLASSGVNQSIAIRTKSGNLTLSQGNALTAQTVSLTADGGSGGLDANNGNVAILGTINASGTAGGEIDLYGKGNVDIEGSLLARGSSATQRGGTVKVGVSGVPDTANGAVQVDPTYGYELMSKTASGKITVGSKALIDVSGGTAGGLSGGTVSFRAPVLDDGSVNVTITPGQNGSTIVGARAVNLEGYAVWSTTDPSTGAQHFDGIVDPAGWYDSQGSLVSGTFTDKSGNTVLTYTAGSMTVDQLTPYLTNDFFTPGSGAANTNHETFYGYNNGNSSNGAGTLMNFINNGLTGVANQFAGTDVANFHVVPGIELDNPSAAINGGNISVLTNWNLGAGTSQANLAYRFQGQAPVITLRAENNVKVKASLTDGFFQIANPLGGGGSIPVPPLSTLTEAQAIFNAPSGLYASYGYGLNYFAKGPNPLAFAPGQPVGGTADQIAEYYALYTAYANYLDQTPTAVNALVGFPAASNVINAIHTFASQPFQPGQPSAPSAPSDSDQATNAGLYLIYLNQYQTYLTQVAQFWHDHPSQQPTITPLVPPAVQPDAVIQTSTVSPPAVTDNTPSPTATASNPLPLAAASLVGGASTSFRVVSGADQGSADPLAVQAASVFRNATGSGSVTLDGHTAYVDTNGVALLVPTMVRTGTGAIDIAAGNSFVLQDATAPGVVYTAGAPTTAAGVPAAGSTASIVKGNTSNGIPDTLVSPSVNPDSAGDITIHAQGDITGIENVIDQDGTISGRVGQNISQFWSPWMETGNPAGQTSINFGAFDQGVMSVGGNVSVSAGGNITDLAVSLPTTWFLTHDGAGNAAVNTVGGGNLFVHAGGNILSGDYFVAKGTGAITAGGGMGTDGVNYTTYSANNASRGLSPIVSFGPVGTLLAVQDGILNVSARQGANIGGVLNPSYGTSSGDQQAYSSTSAVNVQSVTGDVDFGTLAPAPSDKSLTLVPAISTLPASLNLTAFTGGIALDSAGTLYPSATGQLNLVANQTISFSNVANGGQTFGMSDADPSSMPSPVNPTATPDLHASSALHAGDSTPARIYSLNGSIVNGILDSTGFYGNQVTVTIDKPAMIQAGQDIVDLAFQGQNLRAADVTRIVAGRDIYDTPLLASSTALVPALLLGGPGTFDVEAGRNIGPLTNQQQAFVASGRNDGFVAPPTGIEAMGNALNPNLPHESANIQVLFGVGPGVDSAGFISTYIDPSKTVPGVPSTTPALIAFMEQYDAGLALDTGRAQDKDAAKKAVGTLTAAQAWQQFQALPPYVQQLFAEQVLFSVLTDVGQDYNNQASPYYRQYARGYQAINTLFPSSLGYTANNLGGGSNGANKPVDTGDLDMRSTTIQTQQGGSISILGPGGQLLVGSTSAPPQIVDSGKVVAGPGTMGILTLEKGDVNIFTDQSVLLAQSRIFTEQGGDMTIWSSNGDINAGKGSKSSADTPAPQYVCDANHYCTVDARGEVTGAGIATLQSLPGVPAGTVNLIAPRGTVDAGDAGIRAGNLNVAALRVANADNIQVTGKATGIPMVQAVNTGALTAASSAASAASQMAQDIAKNNASGGSQRRWTISVQVEGFGDPAAADQKKRRGAETVGYRPNASVAVLGLGEPGDTQRRFLTREEQNRLSGS